MDKKEESFKDQYFLYCRDQEKPFLVSGNLDYIRLLMEINRESGYSGNYGLFTYDTLLKAYSERDSEVMRLLIPNDLEKMLEEDLQGGL